MRGRFTDLGRLFYTSPKSVPNHPLLNASGTVAIEDLTASVGDLRAWRRPSEVVASLLAVIYAIAEARSSN